MQAQALKITIVDTTNTEMKGEAEVSWTAENTPPALEFIGANSKGFRKFICKNDPSVTFIKIPAAAFDRGDGTYGGTPTEIKMSTYYIAETPTTNAQLKKWRDSAGAPTLSGSWNWNADPSGTKGQDYPDHPAVYHTRNDTINYTYWLITGYNFGQNEKYIFTEAQYEKAARGAKLHGAGNNALEKIWPWGTLWNSSKCNSQDVNSGDERPLYSGHGTTIINKYNSQGYYGIYDITGNVWSWCRDTSASYPSISIDPVVTAGATYLSLRGGSWFFFSGAAAGFGGFDIGCRCSFRAIYDPSSYSPPALRDSFIGIRPCFYWPLQ